MGRLLLTMLLMSFRYYDLPPSMKSHHWIVGEKPLLNKLEVIDLA